jgi:membrane associated rhomboid family serine protease
VGLTVPIAEGLGCAIDRDSINIFTPIISMFLHGGWGHLLGNALFFWVFGNNIEDSMGALRFLAFYLICGLAAAGTHVLIQPASPIPTVGASGAISGVLGAYLVLYPKVRVNMLFYFLIFFKIIPIPAWLVLDLLVWRPGAHGLHVARSGRGIGGVAVWAHIGGFIAGMLLVKVFEDPRLVAQRKRSASSGTGWRPRADGDA